MKLCHLPLLVALASTAVWAQEFRATISGRVLDGSGSAIPAARVQAVNTANNETSSAETDSGGT